MKTKTISLMIIVAIFFAISTRAQINSVVTSVQSVGVSSTMINVTAYGQTTYNCSIVYGHGGYGLSEFETGTYFLDPNVEWTIPIENLQPSTNYVYMVKISWDNYNYTITSSIENFSTLDCPTANFQNTSSTQCSAQLVITEPIDPSYTYQWLKDGSIIPGATNEEFTATETGRYSFRASSFSCELSSNPVDIQIYGIDMQLVAPNHLCAGQTQQVFAIGNAESYLWESIELFDNPNASEPFFHPTESTFITLTVTSDGCEDVVLQQFVAVHEQPKVSISSIDPICENSNQLIQLTGWPEGGTFIGPGVYDNTFDPTQVLGAGIYPIVYKYTSDYGCYDDTIVDIKVTAEPVVEKMSYKNGIFYVNGSFPDPIMIMIGGQTYDASQQDSKEAQFQNVTVQNGDYITIMATGTNGCFITEEFLYGLGAGEIEKDEIKMSANVFSDMLKVELPVGKYKIEIVDSRGNIVEEKMENGNFIIYRNNLKTGMYFLRIISNKKIQTEKILIN